MLRINSRNINYSGISEANDETIGYFSASRDEHNVNVNISIENAAKYSENRIAFEEDLNSFIKQIVEVITVEPIPVEEQEEE